MAEQEQNQTESAIIYPPDWNDKNKIIDLKEDIEDQEKFDNETKKQYLAFGAGAAVELSLGFGGTALWAAKNISTLKKARMLTTAAGVAGPQALEPVSTAGAALSFFGTSAAIWGLSNFAGQSTRNALLNNSEYSAGEIMAASLFGGLAGPSSKFGLAVTGKLTSAGGKLKKGTDFVATKIKVGGSTFADLGVYKGSVRVVEVAGKQGTRMVGGSSFALAETALRQELQLVLNERDSRDATEYWLAIGLGGALNVGTRGAMDLVQTKWGTQLHKRAVVKTQTKLGKEITALEKSIAKDKTKIKPDSNSRSNLMRKDALAVKELKLKEMSDAKYVLDDYALKLDLHSAKIDAAPKKASDLTPEEVAELPELKRGKVSHNLTPEEVAALPEVKPGKVVEDYDVKVEELIKKKNDLTRESGKLAEEFEAQGVSTTEAGKANPLELQKPQIRQDAKNLKKDLNSESETSLKLFLQKVEKGERGVEEATKLLKHTETKLKLNTRLLDDLDQEWAQSGLASQNRFRKKLFGASVERTSARAKAENEGLTIAAKALKGYIQGGKFEELSKIFKGDISEGGLLSASKIAKENVQRLDDKINNLTEQEKFKAKEEGKKFKETKEIKNLKNIKDKQEKVVESEAKSLDETKTKIDDKLGIKLEEYNKLSKTEKTAHLNKRAEELGVKPKKIRSEINALKNKAKTKATKLAKNEITDEQTEFYENIGRAFQKELDSSFLSGTKKLIRTAMSYRKLAMINQVRSIVLGPISGSYAVATRGLVKPWARFLAGFHSNAPKTLLKDRWRILVNDHASTIKAAFSNIPETFKSARISFKAIRAETLGGENVSSSFTDVASGNIPTGPARSIIKQGQNAAKVVAAQNNLLKHMVGKTTGGVKGGIEGVSTLGLRAIVAGDDVFFRILLRQASSQEALKRATEEFPNPKEKNRSAKIAKRAKEIEDSYWEMNEDGIRVFKTTEENVEWSNKIREEMYWAAHSENFGTEVYEPTVDILLKAFSRAEQKSLTVETLRNVLVPFNSVALRTSFLTAKNIFAVPRIIGGRTTFRNPYNRGIKDLQAQQRVLNTRLDEGFVFGKEGQKVPLTKAQIDESNKALIILNERIDTLKARSIDFNVAEYTRMLSTLGLAYAGWRLADTGMLNGSMGWMTDKQRSNSIDAGFKPYSLMLPGQGPIDIRSAAPINLPLVIVGDIQRWKEMKDPVDGESSLLKENQDFFTVLSSSLKTFAMDNPLFSGVKDLKTAVNFENPRAARLWWERLVGGAIPVPAELKNWNKILNGEKQVSDLRGGSFSDRMFYHIFGTPMSEKQFDFFGEPKVNKKNIGTYLGRVLPEDKTKLTPFNVIAVNDTKGILNSSFAANDAFIFGEKLADWVNKDGYSLRTEFAKRLRKTGIKSNVMQAIAELNQTKAFDFKEKNEEGEEVVGLSAYKAINKIRDKSYKNVRNTFIEDAVSNKNFLNTYINRKGEKLGDFLNEKMKDTSRFSQERKMIEILKGN